MSSPAPIALFVYKRLWHTQKTVESLIKNHMAGESELFIFADGAKSFEDEKKVSEVREFIKDIKGFKNVTIIERGKNLGLANSIIDGVNTVINRFGRIIVLEDDMVLSKYFLKYMNDALDLYEKEENVISIHGYIYPVSGKLPETFFLKGADCWGWGTWKRAWELFEPDAQVLLNKIEKNKLEFEFDHNGTTNNLRMLKRQIKGAVDSWAIRWHASAFLENKFTLYPDRSLLNNIGADGEGTHTKSTKAFESALARKEITLEKIPVEENARAKKAIEKYFIKIKPNFVRRYFKILKHRLGS
jgi:GR25 family glycosyltransferase involved in LPS biosynthesis